MQAGSGLEGVAAVAEHDPIITTLDVNLPGIDGFEAARRIRTTSATFIIMLSALGEESDVVLGLTSGADEYLVKPFRPRELRARIEALLRRPRPEPLTGGSPRAETAPSDRIGAGAQPGPRRSRCRDSAAGRRADGRGGAVARAPRHQPRSGHAHRARGAAGGRADPDRVRAAGDAARVEAPGAQQGGSDADAARRRVRRRRIRSASRTSARSRRTWRTCAARSATARPSRATSRPCAGWAIASPRTAAAHRQPQPDALSSMVREPVLVSGAGPNPHRRPARSLRRQPRGAGSSSRSRRHAGRPPARRPQRVRRSAGGRRHPVRIRAPGGGGGGVRAECSPSFVMLGRVSYMRGD